ncbi:hypothetical protein VTO42DRAFT_3877 [Malbranchea cinnamomea]
MARTEDKITLYWLNDSRAQNILWLLEALQLPYEVKIFKRSPEGFAPEELKKVNPLGKSPVITIERPGKPNPLVLFESGNIVEYLVDHYGGAEKGLVPKRYLDGNSGEETESWRRYRFFLHYAEGSLMPNLVFHYVLMRVREAPLPFFIRFIPRLVANKIQSAFLDKQYAVHFPFLENQLKTAPGVDENTEGWLCGRDLTAADILMSFGLIEAMEEGVIQESKFPRLVAYIKRLQANETYKRAVAKVADSEGKPTASL